MKSALVTALGIVLLSGCVKHVTRSQGPDLASVDRSAPYIKAHMRDGGLYILARWKVEPARLKSQGKNTPFAGYEVKGRVRYTLVGGHIVYEG